MHASPGGQRFDVRATVRSSLETDGEAFKLGFPWIWAIGLLVLVAAGIVPLRAFLIFLGVASGTMFLNQVRTLVAHLWENDGEPMSVTAQYLDSVNVPPPATLPVLWAPVGLRYHALHHLLPGVPYHNLGEAHRRLCTELGEDSPYHESSYRRMSKLVRRLAASTLRATSSFRWPPPWDFPIASWV